jgi:protein TonB
VTPAVLNQARPAYPFELRRAGLAGEALIDFIVDPTGIVIGAYAPRATDILFAEAALAAVRQWTFRPGRNAAGQDIAVHMQVPILFELN